MTRFYVVDTETGEDLAGPYKTGEEAETEMLRLFPVVQPWDGETVPVAIEKRSRA